MKIIYCRDQKYSGSRLALLAGQLTGISLKAIISPVHKSSKRIGPALSRINTGIVSARIVIVCVCVCMSCPVALAQQHRQERVNLDVKEH